MDVFEAIKSRRSIRKFRKKPIPEQILGQILDAARWAPSESNAQPWEFIVVKNRKIREEIACIAAEACERALLDKKAVERSKKICSREDFKRMVEGMGIPKIVSLLLESSGIVDIVEHLSSTKFGRELAKRMIKGAFIQAPVHIAVLMDKSKRGLCKPWTSLASVACAVQNMMLAATALGIGNHWYGSPCDHADHRMRLGKLLGIPKNYLSLGILVLGYPDIIPKSPSRKSLSEIVHKEEF